MTIYNQIGILPTIQVTPILKELYIIRHLHGTTGFLTNLGANYRYMLWFREVQHALLITYNVMGRVKCPFKGKCNRKQQLRSIFLQL